MFSNDTMGVEKMHKKFRKMQTMNKFYAIPETIFCIKKIILSAQALCRK